MLCNLRFALSTTLLVTLIGLVGLSLAPSTTAHAQEADAKSAIEGSWEGALETPQTDLRLLFHIEHEGDRLTGTMDSPDQGATGIPLSDVSVKRDTVVFEVETISGRFEGTWTEENDLLDGTWSQSGQSFPLELAPGQEDPEDESQRE